MLRLAHSLSYYLFETSFLQQHSNFKLFDYKSRPLSPWMKMNCCFTGVMASYMVIDLSHSNVQLSLKIPHHLAWLELKYWNTPIEPLWHWLITKEVKIRLLPFLLSQSYRFDFRYVRAIGYQYYNSNYCFQRCYSLRKILGYLRPAFQLQPLKGQR